jgi:hypothetical protein
VSGRKLPSPGKLATLFDPIDRAVLQDHLAQVERRIAHSAKIIARQRGDIEKLERSGCETRTARELVAQFERLLELQIFDRDRLLKKLGSYDAV